MSSPKAQATEARLNALYTQMGPVPAQAGIANITANGPTEIGTALTIPANTLQTGVIWTIDYSGYFSTGGSAPGTVTWTVNWGPVGNAISGAQLVTLLVPAPGLISGAAGLGCHVRCTVWGKSASSTAARFELGWHTAGGAASSVTWFICTANTGLTGGANRDLDLAFAYTGSGMTLQTDAIHIARTA